MPWQKRVPWRALSTTWMDNVSSADDEEGTFELVGFDDGSPFMMGEHLSEPLLSAPALFLALACIQWLVTCTRHGNVPVVDN